MSTPTTAAPDTTTERATVSVDVYGPNLPVPGETFHVHATACPDTRRLPYIAEFPMTMLAHEFDEVVLATYPPSDFEYDPESSEMDTYRQDFKVFPCVHFPAEQGKALSPAEQQLADAKALEEKACREYEEALTAYLEGDESDDDGERDRGRKVDVKFVAALAACQHTRLISAPSVNGDGFVPRGTTSRAKRKQAEPRPGAASKDGEMTCTGPCGETKPVTKFPTTNGGARSTECRACRDARRNAKKDK
jgi:hypothetical protein